MKLYLISDAQIKELYRSGTAGSRNFERVIEVVQKQEISVPALLRAHEVLLAASQPEPPKKEASK